jgi:DNA-binding transcriptional regulator YhcF (GntR family)
MARDDHRDPAPSGAYTQKPLRIGAQTASTEAQFDLEDLKIDRAGEIPIGVQLAWALRARIGDGRLAPGRRLPGLRELAEMVGINANTARAVYQRLEQEGLIDSRQGTGTFVASVTQEPSAVGQIAADAAQEARRTGVDPREVAAALYVTAEPPADVRAHPEGHRQAAERRRELRAQIAALEQTLSEIQARHPGLITTPSKPVRHAGPRLLGVEELEQVRTDLVRRLAAAEPLLETAPGAAQSITGARGVARADTQTGASSNEGRVVGKGTGSRKATHPRPRTRPSTA